MAAPQDYFDTVDLKNALADGLINEDVMQKIWDISHIPLPFTDKVGSDTANNDFTEWTEDSLATPASNKVVSGADAGDNNAAAGTRKGNHCQNSVKVLEVTERAQSTDNIGRGDELAYQLYMRQAELRRDVELDALSNNPSIADDNNTVAGQAGGFSAWLTSNTDSGDGGSDGGFNTGTKIVDAPTFGLVRDLTETMVKNQIENVYINNGNATCLMSGPEVIRRFTDFLLGGSANIAAPRANVMGYGAAESQVAQGFVHVYASDFGTVLTIEPNRLQGKYIAQTGSPQGFGSPQPAANASDVFLIDPEQVSLAYLKPYQTKPLAKLGLSERAEISVDWTVKTYVEKAHAVIRDINPTGTVTA